jgi:hypothetical protein
MARVVLEAGVIYEALGQATAGKGDPQILRKSLPAPGVPPWSRFGVAGVTGEVEPG